MTDLEKWNRHNTYYYKHEDSGRVIHEETFQAMQTRKNVVENSDVTHNDDIRKVINEWKDIVEEETLERSGITSEGYIYKKCAKELEMVIEDD